VTALTLSRLDRSQNAELVQRVTGGKSLPSVLMEHILAHTDGVPLFVEELTKAILESSLLQEKQGHYVLAGPLPPFAVPATLQASLVARLDRLPAIRELAQIGATIGREFSYELLAAVAKKPDADLQDALAQLTNAGLAFVRGEPPDAVYSFKHALVRDAAYGTLLRGRRQQLHAQIADVVESRFLKIAEALPELLPTTALKPAQLKKRSRIASRLENWA
jgi:predicted ATPase